MSDIQDDDVAGNSGAGTEPLACVSCRSRKLKCDRISPACTRCMKVNGECVYPESRRKPTFKRRNVKELEARLGTLADMDDFFLERELLIGSSASGRLSQGYWQGETSG